MTHGGYVIALAIGILTLVSAWATFNHDPSVWKIFLLAVSLLTVSEVHTIGRALFWGALAYEVLNAQPDVSLGKDKYTIMHRLHIGARSEVSKKRKVARLFYTSRSWLLAVEFVSAMVLWLVLICVTPIG
jgi:hypothetical protein